jgi:hypothetical protein
MITATKSRPSQCAASCCVDALLRDRTVDDVHSAVYAEFLYGYGQVPDLDLGAPLRYTRTGSIYQQEFERGVTVANVGTEPVDLFLGRGHLDLNYVLCRYVLVPPHSARVLLKLR